MLRAYFICLAVESVRTRPEGRLRRFGALRSMAAIVSKICVDQSVMAPLGTAAFFAAMKTMEMQPEETWPTLKV